MQIDSLKDGHAWSWFGARLMVSLLPPDWEPQSSEWWRLRVHIGRHYATLPVWR